MRKFEPLFCLPISLGPIPNQPFSGTLAGQFLASGKRPAPVFSDFHALLDVKLSNSLPLNPAMRVRIEVSIMN